MSYNDKLTAINKGLTSIYVEQDRINFAPQLRGDIRLIDENGLDFIFNKAYTSSDENFSDLAGTVWVISGINGWFNLPEAEMPNIVRGFGDGSFDMNGRLAAREITLSGSVLIESGSRSDIDRLNFLIRKKLTQMFYLVRRGTWFIVNEDALLPIEYADYTHPDETATYVDYKRASFVRLSGQPEMDTTNSRGRIDFMIPLRAADPIKYEWVDNLNTVPDFEYISGNGYNLGYIRGIAPTSEFRTYTAGIPDWEASIGFSSDTSFRDYSDDGFTSTSFADYANGYRSYSGDVAVSSQQASSNITCINHGNVTVSCYLRVSGPVYGPAEIRNETTGQVLTILASDTEGVPVVDSNQYLDIDTRTKDVHKGDDVFGESEESSRGLLAPLVDWIELVPGENIINFTDYGSTGVTPLLQVYWRSGWIG